MKYYSGSNLKTLTGKTETECAQECDMELDCVATLYQHSNKYCYLRSTVTGNPSRNGAYTFQRRCGRTEYECPAKAINETTGNECKECLTSGYTYEHKVYMGDTLKKIEDKTWQECAFECDRNTACYAFSYQTVAKRCYLKSGIAFGAFKYSWK